MGMFSKLFGGSGSDKADKMRQMAIDAFNSIKSPALKDLQIQLDKYVQEGVLSPEQAEAELLQSNAFNDIATDPALAGAQKQALMSLQEIGTQGGMTATDKARMADITAEQNATAKGRKDSVMQQAQQRGMGGSDVTTVSQLMEEQAAADRASRRGTEVAASAEARALQALIAAGQTAGQIRGQEFGEEATKAQAENAIDLFNKQTLNQTNLYNVDAENKAMAANLANKQAVSNANVGTENTERAQNAGAVQQVFNNDMAKAQGVAGTYNSWANDASKADAADSSADQAFASGLIQTGATALGTAFGGPVGGMAANSATSNIGGGKTTNSEYDYDKVMRGFHDGGEILPEDEDLEAVTLTGMNCGGEVKMNEGGKTPALPITSNSEGGWTITDPTGKVVGSFKSYAEAAGFANKVQEKQPNVSDFRNGGPVPGQAKVPGNSPVNDTVKAKLSPGEVVVPRTAMSDDEEFDAFMEKFRPSKREKPVDDKPLMVRALQNLSSRVDRMEGR